MDDAHRGAKVGTRVSMLVSHAVVATHKSLIGTKHKLAMMIFRAISDEISAEVDQTLGPILRDLADRHPEDSKAHALLHFMATEHGQLKALVGQGLAQQGLLWPVSQILNNVLSPAVYDALRHDPASIPDASTVAQTAAQGTTGYKEAVNDIAAWGYNSGWAQSMIALAQNWPTYDVVLQLRNRGLVNDAEAETYLKRASLPDQAIRAVLATRITPLSPADAALAVLRSEMTGAEGAKKAALSGIDTVDFNIMVNNTGEPPATMELLEAYRRGFIDRARLVHGILQSRVRNEWVDVLEKLRYAPMSVADAVNAVVQNHLTTAEGERIAEFNGLEPGQFVTLRETAGEPLSRGEMSELVNRGEATLAEFSQALRESRLKDKYIAQAEKLRVRLLEPRMLSEAVTTGSVTAAYAVEVAMKYGYSRQDAHALASHGTMTKLKTYRDRVVAGVEQLLEDNAISQSDSERIIKSMGYADNEVAFITEAAKFRQQARLVSHAITALRSKLVAHHITTNEASGYLDALGVSSAQRDYLMKLWTVELATNVRQLTEAQIVKAVNKKLITRDDGLGKLTAMGYLEADAVLLLEGA